MAAVPQMGVLIMDDGGSFGDAATETIPSTRPTSVRLALESAPERPGLRTVGIVPREKFTLRTAVKAAAAEGLFWIAAPRAVEDPLSVFVDAARGAAGAIDEDHVGFGIILAEPGLQMRKIAVVADVRDPITTGTAAWAAVGLATMFAAELDVLVLGVEEDSQPQDIREAMQMFKIRSQGESMVEDALDRAIEHGVQLRWRSLGTPSDKPAAVLRAVVKGEYDIVLDDLPPLNVGPRPGRRKRVQAALTEEGNNATAYRLVRDAPCAVVVVLDAARMGVAPEQMVRAAAAAAVLGVVGAGTVVASGAAAAASATEAPAEAGAESTAAMPPTEASSVEAAVAQVTVPDTAAATAADLAAMKQQLNQEVAQRNGLDARLKAEQAAQTQKTAELELVQQQQAAIEPALEEARAGVAESERAATYAAIMSSGPLSVLPGGPSSEEAAEAKAAAEAAAAEADEIEETHAALEEQEATLTQDLATLETQITQTKTDLQMTKENVATLEQATSDVAWALNPVVVPTQAGWSISTGFGTGGGYWSSGYHTGLDFAQPQGADVYAAKNGTVVEAGWGGAYGNTIVIQHSDGIQTRYAHLSSINVSVGETVTAGQHIGDVGSTGNSTGPHLHFEVMDSQGNFMDPAVWLGM